MYSIIICSYKATAEFKLNLFQLSKFNITNKNIIIYENSPSNYTYNRDFLKLYNINYINNPDGTHAETLDKAIAICKTKYALILDSDTICLSDPLSYINYVSKNNIQLYGDITGSRGGYLLYKRVNPWWTIIDVDFVKKYNLKYYDINIINKTNSNSFYNIAELNGSTRVSDKYYYDVGSIIYEGVINNNGIIADIGNNKNLPYIHLEGSSWYKSVKQKNIDLQYECNAHLVLNHLLLNKLYKLLNYDEKKLKF